MHASARGPRRSSSTLRTTPPAGCYPETTLRRLSDALLSAGKRIGRTIYVVSDEPYRKLSYNAAPVPGIMSRYPHSIVVHFLFQGPLAARRTHRVCGGEPGRGGRETYRGRHHPQHAILGYVNAPALMQRVVSRIQGASVDVEIYRRKREPVSVPRSSSMGYQLTVPEGAFYLFPKAPAADDLAFVEALQGELILVVPGRGFGLPGYFRIAYCVDTPVIERSLPGFERVIRRHGPESG